MTVSFYESVGGSPTFTRLVSEFYHRVAQDPILRPLYPDDELPEAEVRLRMFLEQYWGGPRAYSEQRGHPRLRQRHVPFIIGERERDAWLTHMREALETVELTAEQHETLWRYLVGAAHSMVNSVSDPEQTPPTTAANPLERRVLADLADRPEPGASSPGSQPD